MNEETINEESGLEVYAKPPGEVSEYEPTKSWGELISAWATVQELGDMSSWTLGDIANEVTRTFGTSKDTGGKTPLDKFAEEVGERPSTVRQYAWVSRTFPARADRMTGLSWSHYRAAVKTEAPMVWIDTAVKESWTVAKLVEEIKNVQDTTSVIEGRPCAQCGGPLPENGAYHVRRDGQKVAAFCCARCGVAWFLEKAQNENNQLGAVETNEVAA